MSLSCKTIELNRQVSAFDIENKMTDWVSFSGVAKNANYVIPIDSENNVVLIYNGGICVANLNELATCRPIDKQLIANEYSVTRDGGLNFTNKKSELKFSEVQSIISAAFDPTTKRILVNTSIEHVRIIWSIPLNEGENTYAILFSYENNPDPKDTFYPGRDFAIAGNRFFIFTDTREGSALLVSDDRGNSWNPLRISSERIRCINFTTSNDGKLLENNGNLYETKDGGESWEFVSKTWSFARPGTWENTSATSMYFIDKENGYIVGGDGLILKTDNGGLNWTKLNLDLDIDLFKVVANNKGGVWIATRDGQILESLDAGQAWTKINVSKTSRFYPYNLALNLEKPIVTANERVFSKK